MSLANAAQVVSGSLIGTDARFVGVSSDTRTLRREELFFALQGPNHDGHEFVVEAAQRGAAGACLHVLCRPRCRVSR